MTIYDIAKLYRDSNATVQFMGEYEDTYSGDKYSSLGSGVVVASTGYRTKNLPTNITASRGSYIATNYHVVDFLDNSGYTNKSLKVRAEDEIEYDCEVLWANKNLDVAVVYADVSYNYITMKDRWVACEQNQRLDYEPAFAIGSPLEKQNINRMTVGNIASNNEVTMFTSETVYVTYDSAGAHYTPVKTAGNQTPLDVLDNVYEKVIDISVGISGGNSGGGIFDANGNLVGLATLGTSADQTGGNQLNGAVPIYPIIKVIDKVIANHESSTNYKIYTASTLGIAGIDETEAAYAKAFKEENHSSYFFANGTFYANTYSIYFDFEGDGYEILTNSNTYNQLINIRTGAIITSIKTADGVEHKINDRNDLLYLLIGLNEGDSIVVTYETERLFGTNVSMVNVTV